MDGIDTSGSAAVTAAVGAAGGDSGPFTGSSPAAAHSETFQPAQPTYLEAPQSWRREVADRHWNRLDHDLRQYLHQRETEAHRAITSHSERLKPWDDLLSQHGSVLPAGIAPHEAVGYLLNAQRVLADNPVQALAHLAAHYGVDPWQLMAPEMRQQVQQQFEMQQRRIAAAEAAITVREQAREQQLMKEFAKQRRAEEAARAEENERRLVDAQRAARLNVRSGGPVARNPQSVDDTLNEIATRHYGT